MSNIAELESGNRWYDVTHPKTGEPIGLKIELRPMDSEEMKKVTRDLQADGLRNRGRPVTPEKVERNRVVLLTAAIADMKFEGDANWNGKTEFNSALVREILTDKKRTWLRDQIEREVNDESAFFQS